MLLLLECITLQRLKLVQFMAGYELDKASLFSLCNRAVHNYVHPVRR